MNWEKITGQKKLINQLISNVDDNRVSHAQLFVGEEGYGVFALALAYAREILSRENEHAASKIDHLNHLDLHFSFPSYTTSGKALSKNFFPDFRELTLENPYFDYDDWAQKLESDNKQLFISVHEMEEIAQKFVLKSFEGGTKILIVWRADKMNIEASNKFLKLLEEPPEKTVIILTATNKDDLLQTITSRTQIVEVPRIIEFEIGEKLINERGMERTSAESIAHQSQGNWNTALKIFGSENADAEFEELFVQWVRDASMVKKRPEFLKNIVKWARNISGWNREKQKNFLDYCAEIFRLALLQNYGTNALVYKTIAANNFKWDKFSNFIHGANIEDILTEINTADHHLMRNGNSKIIWTDLGIKLSIYIHKNAL